MSPPSRYVRALGWAAFAAAPVLLSTLAVISARPHAPGRLLPSAMIVAWLAGAFAFGGSLLHARGARRVGRGAAIGGTAIVVGWSIFLGWVSIATRIAVLDEDERAELVFEGGSLRHPTLTFSLSDPDLEVAADLVRELEEAGGPVWARAHRVWAWRDEHTEVSLDLSRAPLEERTIERTLEDMREALRRAGHRVTLGERIDASEARVEAELTGGGRLLQRVFLFSREGRGYRLVANVTTRDADRWRSWLDALQVE